MLYEKYAHAWDTQDIDMLGSLCHPDFEMVMHSSGSIASKSEYIDLVGPLMQKFRPEARRCYTKMMMCWWCISSWRFLMALGMLFFTISKKQVA